MRSGRNREILLEEIRNLHDTGVGEMYVKEIKLKQSILTKKGPVYKDVKVFGLVV